MALFELAPLEVRLPPRRCRCRSRLPMVVAQYPFRPAPLEMMLPSVEFLEGISSRQSWSFRDVELARYFGVHLPSWLLQLLLHQLVSLLGL